MDYQGSPAILFVVGSLIVAGGLGFLSMSELRLMGHDLRKARARRTTYDDLPPRPRRMTIHTRIVLITTAALIVSGGALYLILEWSVTLASMGFVDRVVNALFMSVTARTAGFNSVDYAVVSDGGNFLTILLMLVGGSPGSTAGGIKTTTLALLILLAVARLRGRDAVEVAHRMVPERTVQRAVGLMVLVLFVLTAAVFVLAAIEIGTVPHGQGRTSFIAVVFEAVSALNTVGLSMGITTDLSAFGRWIMILLMFLGRVGPMTFAASLSRTVRTPHEVRLPSQDVLIG
jgi:trk system potassium uptake protein TrkH